MNNCELLAPIEAGVVRFCEVNFMTKYEFLQWLDDVEVQQKILRIVKELQIFFEPVKPPNESPPPDEKLSRLELEKNSTFQRATTAERQLSDLRSDNFRLKNNLSEVQQRVEGLEQQIQNVQFKNSQLENSLSQAQQRVKDLEQQIQNAQFKNSRLQSSLSQSEQSARSLQDKLKTWQETFTREQQRNKSLQQDLDAANQTISDLERQLEQRFARGWELFQKYQSVGTHARQLLQGVFTRDNFMSFICGGAQSESLEKIWDVLRECVMNSRQHDAEILWEVFEYSLELVNSSRAQVSYSILPVNVGDRFDSDVHSEAPGSRAQGKVAQVYLPGFRNDYNRRIIRKSIVQVS